MYIRYMNNSEILSSISITFGQIQPTSVQSELEYSCGILSLKLSPGLVRGRGGGSDKVMVLPCQHVKAVVY